MTVVMIRPKTFEGLLGISKSTAKRWNDIQYGPRRVRIGPRSSGYSLAEVDAFIRERSAQREQVAA
jgi:predicted DNA-binding transcriptional regulator AlpA